MEPGGGRARHPPDDRSATQSRCLNTRQTAVRDEQRAQPSGGPPFSAPGDDRWQHVPSNATVNNRALSLQHPPPVSAPQTWRSALPANDQSVQHARSGHPMQEVDREVFGQMQGRYAASSLDANPRVAEGWLSAVSRPTHPGMAVPEWHIKTDVATHAWRPQGDASASLPLEAGKGAIGHGCRGVANGGDDESSPLPKGVSALAPVSAVAKSTRNNNTYTAVAPAVANSRKRQFRFAVRDDVELLRLAVRTNPYAAAHGGRLQKWQAIAEQLRGWDIDIDFRRARDRCGLLLDQWRDKDYEMLRRSVSGNHEDQVQKESLLSHLSQLEHTARPRDGPVERKNRESQQQPATATAEQKQTSLSSQGLLSPPGSSSTAAISIAPKGLGSARPSSVGPSPSASLPSSQVPLPSIMHAVQKQEQHLRLPRHQMHNQQQQLQHRRLSQQQQQHYVHPHGPVSTGFNSGHLSRSHAQSSMHAASFDGGSVRPEFGAPLAPHATPGPSKKYRYVVPVSSTASPADDHSFQPGSSDVTKAQVQASSATPSPVPASDTRDPLQRATPCGESGTQGSAGYHSFLERRLNEELELSRKRIALDERRLEWEKERETKRMRIEHERLEREFEDRKAEREERKRREAIEKEERATLLQIILRGQQQSKTQDAAENEQRTPPPT